MNYRRIFQDDKVSFGEMQVYPLAKEYIENPEKLEGIWVYDDEFVKWMGYQICYSRQSSFKCNWNNRIVLASF